MLQEALDLAEAAGDDPLAADIWIALFHQREGVEDPGQLAFWARRALALTEAVRQFYATDRSEPPLTLVRPDAEPVEGLSLAIVQNTSPWTYFGNRAIDPSPDAAFEKGDLLADRGLAETETARRAAEGHLFGHRTQSLEVPELHAGPARRALLHAVGNACTAAPIPVDR